MSFFCNVSGYLSFIRQNYGLYVFGNPYWTCQLLLVPFFGCSMSSAFFILSMTFERFYSIVRPHKAASFNTVKRAKITIACIVAFFMVFNIPRLFLSKMEGQSCLPYGQGSTFWSQLYFYTEMMISFIFPFISLLSMNCLIIFRLKNRSNFLVPTSQHQGHVEGQNQSEGEVSKMKSTETQITMTLLVVTFSFLTLTTPGYIMMMYLVLIGVGTTPKGVATFYFLFQVGEKTYYVNYAVNFFLYVISGKKFRTDLVTLYMCTRKNTRDTSVLS